MEAGTPDLERLGQNVKAARVARAWTQEQLVHELDQMGRKADRGYISRVEAGKHNPGATTVIQLARALGVRPADLLDGID